MRICFDLDGVITRGVHDYPHYDLCEINSRVVGLVRYLTKQRHIIIIHSARYEDDRELTEIWLKDNGVPFDELVLGKPLADIYIDDKGIRFDGDWEELWSTVSLILDGQKS